MSPLVLSEIPDYRQSLTGGEYKLQRRAGTPALVARTMPHLIDARLKLDPLLLRPSFLQRNEKVRDQAHAAKSPSVPGPNVFVVVPG